jgi:cyclopropane fatty-acyl-phospholipid synthase-like methyltransferase
MQTASNNMQLKDTFRSRLARALHAARNEAYPEGEYVGQESFVTAHEILALASAAGVNDGALVLDSCCGTGGPALHLTKELGCRIMGVDRSVQAIHLAQAAAENRGLARNARFLVADACQLPFSIHFDAVLLLETVLAIEDKPRLLHQIRSVLRFGGRLGLTIEVGEPLSRAEQQRMPEGDQVWLLPENEFLAYLEATGFQIYYAADHTGAHAALAERLAVAFHTHRNEIAAFLGPQQANEIVVAHQQWVEWLTARRIRKLILVAERVK